MTGLERAVSPLLKAARMASGEPTEERLRAALAGRYQIHHEIGRGGMATVYLAHDLKYDRPVAIKVLRQEGEARDASSRFRREIRVTAQLSHPHILPLLDSDSLGGLEYYVMPFVEGESLRDRIQREGRLPIDQSLRIANEIAGALAYAHDHGLVHRDIKPANILFEAGHAVLADFGVVRPTGQVDAALTQEGRVLGTPHYQSPEQWRGETTLDGRSDVYSLGCVLFEMLTGEPPFRGPSTEAVAGKHLHEGAPPVSILRPKVSAEVDEVVRRAMEKDPADRFESASGFRQALDTALNAGQTGGSNKPTPVQWGWAKRVAQAAALLGVLGLVWVGRDLVPGLGGPPQMAPDTTRYAVFSFAYQSGVEPRLDAAQRLNQALERWVDLSVADPVQARELEASLGEGRVTANQLASVARSLGAGRFVRGSVGAVGDEFVVNAELWDAMRDAVRLEGRSIRLPPDLAGADSLFSVLANHLLFRDAAVGDELPLSNTASLASYHAFLEGWRRLADGNLAASDSAFSKAIDGDPENAEANLWVALSRAWQGVDLAQWRSPAQKAGQSPMLSHRNEAMAEAILAQANGDFPLACTLWTDLTERQPEYFGAWLGAATCQVADEAVLQDARSPSGWSFRTSYHGALTAYKRAFALFPPVLTSFRRGSYAALRHLFMTTASARRSGWSEGSEPIWFVAVPAWKGDTLALVPYPTDSPELQLTVTAQELERAVHNQRASFHDVAQGWASSFPSSRDAKEALSISLSMLGDPSALEEIRLARSLAEGEGERLRLAGVEAFTGLAFSLPGDTEGVQRARALADSVLAGVRLRHGYDPLLLAGLAALTGRADQAATLMRTPGVAERIRAPRLLRETAPPLLLYAALGGPADTLDALEARVRTAIEDGLLPSDQVSARLAWLARPATLAFFEHMMGAVQYLRGAGDLLLDLQAALARGDTAFVREGLENLRQVRAGLLPSSITLDSLLPETELLFLLGEMDAAAEWLDPALRALPQMVPWIITDPVRAAALVRALALRAKIADALGDPQGASRWREAVTTLWSNADPFLQPPTR